MSKRTSLFFLIALLFGLSINTTLGQSDSLDIEDLTFKIGKSQINTSLWTQPYRFEDKQLKALSVQVTIERNAKNTSELDFNEFYLIETEKNLRIRPVAVFYYRGEKKIYLKSRAVNQNYNEFKEVKVEGYQNFEAKTFKPNFLGKKKKNTKPSIQALKKMNVKAKKVTYYLDFPVTERFSYAKVFYKSKTIGFAAVKN